MSDCRLLSVGDPPCVSRPLRSRSVRWQKVHLPLTCWLPTDYRLTATPCHRRTSELACDVPNLGDKLAYPSLFSRYRPRRRAPSESLWWCWWSSRTAVLMASGGDCMETRALGSTRTIAIIIMISDSTVGPRYYELLQLNKCNFNTYSILGSMTYTGSGTYMYMNNL